MKKLTIILAALLAMAFAGNAQAGVFATTLVDYSESLDGSGYYNDANDLIGAPATYCAGWPSGNDHISIVEPSWGDGYITTFGTGDWAVVSFDHYVENDPNNPYGLDLIVYGNSFFVGNGYVADDTDHTSYTLTGSASTEATVQISVSQNGTTWYTFDDPYGDDLYPTNPWVWDPDLYDSTGNGWTTTENDYTLPVDPDLDMTDFYSGISSYEAMLLYGDSAGGTGFDLSDLEEKYDITLDWIQYVKLEGTTDSLSGEIDAIADVSPVPIPGAVWLLGGGLLGLIGIRRRNS